MVPSAIKTHVALALALGVTLGACSADDVEELDPAGALGDEEWSDDGPTDADAASDRIDVPADVPADELAEIQAGVPLFQLPFPCGQVWAGQTRTAHSPTLSVDFNRTNDEGDTVVAAAGGTVTRVANEGNTSYGRWIEIAHSNGYRTRYAHLSAQLVSVGQSVARGQSIGRVGTTGGSSGPHLHYEQRLDGVAVRARFNGITALYFTTKNYTSQNRCATSGGGVVGRVNTSGAALTVRTTASTSSAALGSVADGSHVTITCQKRAQTVNGTYGSSNLWDKIGTGFIADAYVSTGSDGQVAPTCP